MPGTIKSHEFSPDALADAFTEGFLCGATDQSVHKGFNNEVVTTIRDEYDRRYAEGYKEGFKAYPHQKYREEGQDDAI